LLKARLGQSTLLVAQNKKGIWYQYEAGCIYKTKAEIVPSRCAPRIHCTFDPKTETASCVWGASDSAQPDIDIAPAVVPYTVALIHKSSHVWTEKRGENTAFVFQHARWNAKETLTLELEVDRSGVIRQAKCTWPEEKDTISWITLADIKIGEPLPQEAFEVTIPAGTNIREVDQVNQLEAFGHAMNMLGTVTGPIQSKLKRK
jgi:hypothetical protein